MSLRRTTFCQTQSGSSATGRVKAQTQTAECDSGVTFNWQHVSLAALQLLFKRISVKHVISNQVVYRKILHTTVYKMIISNCDRGPSWQCWSRRCVHLNNWPAKLGPMNRECDFTMWTSEQFKTHGLDGLVPLLSGFIFKSSSTAILPTYFSTSRRTKITSVKTYSACSLLVCAVTEEVTVAYLTSVNRKMCLLNDKIVIWLGTRDCE